MQLVTPALLFLFGRAPFGVATLRVSLRSWLRHRFAALQAAHAKTATFINHFSFQVKALKNA
jgi:hypothetical protein